MEGPRFGDYLRNFKDTSGVGFRSDDERKKAVEEHQVSL